MVGVERLGQRAGPKIRGTRICGACRGFVSREGGADSRRRTCPDAGIAGRSRDARPGGSLRLLEFAAGREYGKDRLGWLVHGGKLVDQAGGGSTQAGRVCGELWVAAIRPCVGSKDQGSGDGKFWSGGPGYSSQRCEGI